jgi:anti-anti-sigma factor
MSVQSPGLLAGRISETFDDGATVALSAAGAFDLSNAHLLRRHAIKPLLAGRNLSIDMSGVSFMDVTCLDVLLTAERSFRERGRRLVLCNPSRPVARLAHIAGVSQGLVG